MPTATPVDQLLVAFWGWPGVVLLLLAAWELAERAFHWPPVLSGRIKIAAASLTVALALISMQRGLSLPADDLTLGAEIERRRKDAARQPLRSRLNLDRRADSLRRDLARDGDLPGSRNDLVEAPTHDRDAALAPSTGP